MNILTVNLLFSTFVFWVAARIYLGPRLPGLAPRTVLLPILLLHSTRHLGLMFLAPGATYAAEISPQAHLSGGIRRSHRCFAGHGRDRGLGPRLGAAAGCWYGSSTWRER